MVIYILTYHFIPNFGANLQAFTISKLLESKNIKSKIIDYRPYDLKKIYIKKIPKDQQKKHEDFVKKLPLSDICYNEMEIVNLCKLNEINGIIVGSDAVLRLDRSSNLSFKRFPNPYWLNWINNIDLSSTKTATLSVSIMGSNYMILHPLHQLGIYRSLKKFNILTVRDYWTKWLFKLYSMGIKKPVMNPDPLFMLNNIIDIDYVPKNYEKLTEGKKFILFSFCQNIIKYEWLKKFKKVANKNGYLIGELPMPEGYSGCNFDFKVPYPLDPLEWYYWIKNSNGYIGQRFHALVSAMSNMIPFIIIDNYSVFPFSALRIRFPSKIFDLCYQSNFLENRFTEKKIKNTPPHTILKIIEKKNIKKLKSFAEQSRVTFSKNLNIILNSFF